MRGAWVGLGLIVCETNKWTHRRNKNTQTPFPYRLNNKTTHNNNDRYALPGMEGARVWYWTREELEVLVASGRVQLHPLPPAAAAPAAAAQAEPAEGGGRGGGAGGGVDAHDTTATTDLPTRALFTALLCPSSVSSSSSSAAAPAAAEWTPEMDEALVRVANAAAAKRGLPAAPHVGRGELLAALRSQARGPLRSFLTRHGAAPVLVRFAALLWLNEAVETAAPLIDLGCASSFSPPSTFTTLRPPSPSTAPAPAPALRALTTAWDEASAAVAGSGGGGGDDGLMTPLGKTLAALRGSIFTSAKLGLWHEVLRETTTPTVPPADEYERPEELREVALNRMQARRALTEAERLGPEEKLRLSLFGQLRAKMSGWDDRALRRAYVHMQDAGQPRAFYVKLIGEGVDDHGGPYRAVFETAVGEEPAGGCFF